MSMTASPSNAFAGVSDGTLERHFAEMEKEGDEDVVEAEVAQEEELDDVEGEPSGEDTESADEASPKGAEGASEGDEDKAGDDEDKESQEAVESGPWAFNLRVNHQDLEYDPYEDPERTKELLQKGLSYDEKHGVERAVQEATARTQAEVTERYLAEMEQRGFGRRSALDGSWEWSDRARQVFESQSPSESRSGPTTVVGDGSPTTAPDEDTKLAELRANAGKSQDDFERYLAAREKATRKSVIEELRAEQREEQEKTQRTVQQQQAHTQVNEHFTKVAARDANYFRNPFTKEIDADASAEAVEAASAKVFNALSSGKSVNEAVAAGEKTFRRHAKRSLQVWRNAYEHIKSRRGAKPSPSPSPAGKPSRSGAPQGTSPKPVIDPRRPFDHIDHE